MAGYHNYSMSNNAKAAYQSGERPLSKWTKGDMMAVIAAIDPEIAAKIKSCAVATLRKFALRRSSWHHTSSWYNTTDFYEVDEYAVSTWNEDEIKEIIEFDARAKAEKAAKKDAPTPTIRRKVRYLTWEGTRKHPKAVEHTEECEIVGNWAMTSNGKKLITANGFAFLD